MTEIGVLNQDKPTVTTEIITPEMATEILVFNLGNRKPSADRAHTYALDMAAGKWALNGESIKIATNGNLLDGQTRLMACIIADTPFETLVIRGIAIDAMPSIDTGRPRSVGDALHWEGHTNGGQLAAITISILAYHSGRPADDGWASRNITRSMQIEFVNTNGFALHRSLKIGRRLKGIGAISNAAAAFFYLVTELWDDEHVMPFIDNLVEGARLAPGDPALALRNWFINPKHRRSRSTHLSSFIRGWNAHSSGQSLTIIRPWFPGQPFPRIEAP